MVVIKVILCEPSEMTGIVSYINQNINTHAGVGCTAALCALISNPLQVNNQWTTYGNLTSKSFVSLEESIYEQHKVFFDALSGFEIMNNEQFQINYPNFILAITE